MKDDELLKKQLELADEILNIQNNCSEGGEYTYNQLDKICQAATQLAGIVSLLAARPNQKIGS